MSEATVALVLPAVIPDYALTERKGIHE